MHQSIVKKICVCGAGTMGRGIAQLAAQSGFKVILFDVKDEILRQATAAINKSLEVLVEKGKLTADEQVQIVNRVNYTSLITECQADLIIEAIVERLSAKIDLFTQLASINKIDTVFATNTSSISITRIASSLEASDRVVGMHFFNPAPIMKLVEIVRGKDTSAMAIKIVSEVANIMSKTIVVCKDSPGFIVNRVARPFYLEPLQFVEAQGEVNEASFALVDKLLESSGFKMGPFRLMDLIGNDINFAVSNSVYEQMGKPPRLKPSMIQENKVNKGELGTKSGKGYYQYG